MGVDRGPEEYRSVHHAGRVGEYDEGDQEKQQRDPGAGTGDTVR